jgi:hypothetical protein
MPEILFIAIDPCIVALIDDLQQRLKPEIHLESDYSSGIRRIFDTRPSIVFLQHKIGSVTCDKLANQVKMLLEGEAVPLVLLSDEPAMSYSVVSTYEACFDLCLPLDELSWQVQQLLHTLPEILWKESPESTAPQRQMPCEAPAETTLDLELELELPAGSADFSQPFPWLEEKIGENGAASLPDLGGTLTALEGNAVQPFDPAQDPGPEESQFLVDFLEERLDIEPLPLYFEGSQQQEKPAPESAAVPAPESVITPAPAQTAAKSAAQQRAIGDLQRIEREAPGQVFGSMSETGRQPSFVAAKRFEPKPAAKGDGSAAPRRATASPQKKESGAAPAGPARQPVVPEVNAQQQGSPADDELSDQVSALLGVKKVLPWYYQGLIIGILLLICIASLDLFFTLRAKKFAISRGIGDINATLNTPHRAPTSAAPATRQLPQFIPQVPPDPAYPASHPGWERYRSDGLEYLVYREKGSIRAVQVLSEERGAITAPFLKTCIRLSSGNEQFVINSTQNRGAIQVTSGTLRNGGELVIYRVIPDGEVRGFVLTYPVGDRASVRDEKR